MSAHRPTVLVAACLLSAVALAAPAQSQDSCPNQIRSLVLPFLVGEHFHPSGWMGDPDDIHADFYHKDCDREGDDDGLCAAFTYRPSGSKRWAGIYWQHPDGNWGQEPDSPTTALVGQARRVTFWAKGETGTEKVEFKAGGLRTRIASLGRVELTDSWTQHVIALEDRNFSCLIGAFVWAISADHNPRGATFYLDEIRYE